MGSLNTKNDTSNKEIECTLNKVDVYDKLVQGQVCGLPSFFIGDKLSTILTPHIKLADNHKDILLGISWQGSNHRWRKEKLQQQSPVMPQQHQQTVFEQLLKSQQSLIHSQQLLINAMKADSKRIDTKYIDIKNNEHSNQIDQIVVSQVQQAVNLDEHRAQQSESPMTCEKTTGTIFSLNEYILVSSALGNDGVFDGVWNNETSIIGSLSNLETSDKLVFTMNLTLIEHATI